MAEFMAHNRDILVRTARALGPLCERFVFIGGSIVELLITDEAGPSMDSSAVRTTLAVGRNPVVFLKARFGASTPFLFVSHALNDPRRSRRESPNGAA